jgi:hypothetical protein
MSRGPDSLFAYWDLTGAESRRLRREFGDACKWVLRVRDTATGWQGDTPVDPQAGSRYVTLRPGGAYAAQLGLMVEGTFHLVCESDECRLPHAEPRLGAAATWVDSRSGEARAAAPGRRPSGKSMAGLAYDPASESSYSSLSQPSSQKRQGGR